MSGCGGGGGGGGGAPATYSIGGSVSGLTGTGLVLQDNAADNLTVAANATSFKFTTAIAGGDPYSVTVLSQPTNPSQTCAVSQGSGTVASSNISSVSITCKSNAFTVGGTISGLKGTSLVLQDNSGDNLTLTAGATSFQFSTALLPAAAYSVTVLTQPSKPAQFCTVTNGSGTVANANVTNIAIACNSFGRFLFVANATGGATSAGNVSAFSINADGTLSVIAGSPYAADMKPSGIVVDPSGQYVYVSNSASADVSVYSVDSTKGALTLRNQAPSKGVFNTAIAMAPSGQYLFVGGTNNSGTSDLFGFSRDTNTGVLTADPNSPYGASDFPYGLAVDPTSEFLFVTAQQRHEVHSYKIGNVTTSLLLTETVNSPVSTASEPYGAVVSPLGNASGGFLFTADAGVGRVSVFSYDTLGNLTELTSQGSPWPSGGQSEGLAIDPTGTCLYVANYADGTVSSFSVAANGVLTANQTENGAVSTGNLSQVPNPGPIDVKVDPAAPYVYVVNSLDGSVSLFSTANCTLTLINTYPTDSGAVAVAID